jgi:DNA-binding response OmpR family regulator
MQIHEQYADRPLDRPTMTGDAEVLVVDDDEGVVWTYQQYLDADYVVHTASGGEEALATLESENVDVVLLDRMMPGMSGREVLEEIRDREYDCRVAMVTAVDPDFDIVEMGFDDYVTKPSSKSELCETVADLLSLSDYTDQMLEYHSLVSKRVALEERKSESELEASDEYARLEEEIESVRSELSGFDVEDDSNFLATIRSLDRGDETHDE